MSTFNKIRYVFAFVQGHSTTDKYCFTISPQEKKILQDIGRIETPAGFLYCMPEKYRNYCYFYIKLRSGKPFIACRHNVQTFLKHAITEMFPIAETSK